jgi:hypothetical protein
MKNNLVRISKASNLPLTRSTLRKWKSVGKYPQMFIKLGGAVFIDLDALEEVIEAGRLKGDEEGGN